MHVNGHTDLVPDQAQNVQFDGKQIKLSLMVIIRYVRALLIQYIHTEGTIATRIYRNAYALAFVIIVFFEKISRPSPS